MTTIDPYGFLRQSLRGNAAFSILSGTGFALGSGAIAAFLGEVAPLLVLAIGLQLLVFAAALLWLASRPAVSLPLAVTVIAADLLWVLGTVVVLSAGVFTSHGGGAAMGVAGIVLLFAVLQSIGVKRARADIGVAAA